MVLLIIRKKNKIIHRNFIREEDWNRYRNNYNLPKYNRVKK